MSDAAFRTYEGRRADPGVGDPTAPIGSEGWAQRVRLSLQSIIKDLPKTPERARGYFELIREHRAWTLMNKPDGSYFKTIEEFCEHRQPWGLGRPWKEIEPFLVAAAGKQAVQLASVAPAQSPPGKATEKADTVSAISDERRDQRLRAILRAPEQVQQLYREGLIGQKEAAKLGPKNPSPEEAARAVEVTQAVVAEAKAAKPATDAEKAKVQRRVNERVRELAGGKPDAVAVLLRAFERLTPVDQKRARALLCGVCS